MDFLCVECSASFEDGIIQKSAIVVNSSIYYEKNQSKIKLGSMGEIT
jgi:hypothetical protein